jgi:MinD-like ATPase involved in chromosome partitioning or flagellar assembly
MFTTTFYSFRGGVGRTMAIVNIGTWLARHGRRVLLVDFDLESPGISHYALPNSTAERKGVIDYLYEMIEGPEPTSLEDYYYESFQDKGGGALYVMPAGRASTHVARFEKLNLGQLYQEGDGYLILENLKAMWETQLAPDYVLIDSRTGYNEVAGICTRQLPDAVVATFIPSPQNLNGLKEVISQIRAQNRETWRPEIQLHFLASSIPSIDDENGDIADAIARSQQLLEFDQLLGSVYYIPSAAHLTQVVFTLEKAQSRLARNFGEVARALTMVNPEDAEGAKAFLARLLAHDRALTRSTDPARLDQELKTITQRHSGNVEVLFSLARVRLRQALVAEALSILDSLLETDPNAAQARLLRATLYAQRQDSHRAEDDLRLVLSRKELDVLQVSQALRTLASVSPQSLRDVAGFQSYAALDTDSRASLLLDIAGDYPDGLENMVDELVALADASFSDLGVRDAVSDLLTVYRIQQRHFMDALVLTNKHPESNLRIERLFNKAIAAWGVSGAPREELFDQLLAKAGKVEGGGPSHLQRMALAYAAVEQKDAARALLESAQLKALRVPRSYFSVWTYATVSAETFADHIAQMLRALETGHVTPPVVRPLRG